MITKIIQSREKIYSSVFITTMQDAAPAVYSIKAKRTQKQSEQTDKILCPISLFDILSM